jgi:hypothetical protein
MQCFALGKPLDRVSQTLPDLFERFALRAAPQARALPVTRKPLKRLDRNFLFGSCQLCVKFRFVKEKPPERPDDFGR